MPNLLIASGIFHPEAGGPATYLRQVLPALLERGWQIRVLTYGSEGVHSYPYSITRVPRQVFPLRLARYGWRSRSLHKWADLTYLQTIDLPLWGARGPRVMKVVGDQAWERCVRKGWIPNGMGIDAFQGYRGGKRARWQKASRSRQVNALDAIVVPSDYLRRMVAGWGVPEARIHTIYNALPPLTLTRESRQNLRRALDWDERPTLLTVARLHPWKGIDHLVQALKSRTDLRLVVVGAGPDETRLRSLAKPLGDRVVFMGALPSDETHRLMAAADAFALYSGYEGLSHSLLEALRLGAPALASDVGGNPEVIRDGVNGLLVPYVDHEALLQGIDRLLANRDRYAANASAGLERFDFAAMVRRTDSLLKSLLR